MVLAVTGSQERGAFRFGIQIIHSWLLLMWEEICILLLYVIFVFVNIFSATFIIFGAEYAERMFIYQDRESGRELTSYSIMAEYSIPTLHPQLH